MPTLADLKTDPNTGVVQNPQDFTPGQLQEASSKGLISYQGYQQALPNAAKPANNQADIAASMANNPANDLSKGTTAQGTTVANTPPTQLTQQPSQQAPASNQVQLTAPPAQSNQNGDPRDSALAAMLAPRATARTAPTSLDKAYLDDLAQKASGMTANLQDIADQTKQHANNMNEQTNILATQGQVAKDIFDKERADEIKKRSDIMADHQKSQSRINAELDRLQSQNIDPKRYFKEAGTAANISNAVMVGLTQFGQGLAHRQGNPALDIINSSIERDIESQKENLQKNFNILSKRMQVGQNGFDANIAMLNAERESYQTAYTVAARDIEKKAAMYKDNAGVQQNATQLLAGIEEKKQQVLLKYADDKYKLLKQYDKTAGAGGLTDAQRKQITERIATIRDKGAGEGKDVSPEEARRQAVSEIIGFNAKPDVPYQNYSKDAKGPEAKQKEELLHVNSALSSIDQMLALREKHNGGSLNRDDTAAGEALARDAQGELGKSLSGRFTESEIKVLRAMVPDDPLELKASVQLEQMRLELS